MKKILILGSKPGATIPAEVDYVYAANASAHFYKGNISPRSKLIIVASAGVMYRIDLSKKPKFYKIIDALRDSFVVSGVDKIPGAKEKICHEVNVKSIKYYSAEARRKIFNSVVGGYFISPIFLSFIHGKIEPSYFLKYLYHLARGKWKNADLPGQYRPSTALFALAYAISEHSADSQFIVTGIGFDRRESYPDGGDVENQKHHLIPDTLYFSELRNRYQIKTTDALISKQFSIPLQMSGPE